MKYNDIIAEHSWRLKYCPDTGDLTWLCPMSNRVKVGDLAGTISPSTGYRTIGLGGKNAAAHRIAWHLATGDVPSSMIDHINGIRTDNRLCNLRPASNSLNKMNAGAHKDSKSKYVGVFWEKAIKKWRVQIMADGIKTHIGVYKSEEAAAKAYDRAALKFHGNFAKTNFAGGAS